MNPVRRHRTGVFTAELDGLEVRGWSRTVAEMHQIVRRLGGGGHLLSASADVADNDADPQHTGAGYLDHGDLTIGELGMRAVDTLRADDFAAINEIRSRIPRTDAAIVEWRGRRADELEASAPQVGDIEAFNNDYRAVPRDVSTEARSCAYYLGWVDTQQIVHTPDRPWADFGGRRAYIPKVICRALREATTAEALRQWVNQFSVYDPVGLVRVDGPGGPIFAVTTGGSHRVHTARMLGLPKLLGLVRTSMLPQPLYLHARPYGPTRVDRHCLLWRGLRERGLLEVDTSSVTERWVPTRMTAEWLLMPPTRSAPINAAHNRIYPGALSAVTGLSDAQLSDPVALGRALIGSPWRPRLLRRWAQERADERRLRRQIGTAFVPRGGRADRRPAEQDPAR